MHRIYSFEVKIPVRRARKRAHARDARSAELVSANWRPAAIADRAATLRNFYTRCIYTANALFSRDLASWDICPQAFVGKYVNNLM